MILRPYIIDVWIASIALQVLLMIVLVIRRAWTRFPLFTAYAAFNVFEAGITFAVSKNGMLYFYVYWACQAIATILGLAVVYEVFNALLSPHAALTKIARMIFRVTAIFLVLLGFVVVMAEVSANRNVFGSVSSAAMVIAEAARFVEMGLLMFLFLFSSTFGLHWRAHIFGIALGLGVFVAIDLVNVTLRSHLGTAIPADVLSLARGAAFCISVSMWAAYLLLPERVSSSDEVPKTAQLEQWNQAVMELISR